MKFFIESRAGELSGFTDTDFSDIGVTVLPDAAALYGKAELVVKVKEPIAGDLEHLRSEHLLFCYLHLAAEAGADRPPAGNRFDRGGILKR